MPDPPRVVLLISPTEGYDRGILYGIARYARNHGPWILHVFAYQAGFPLLERVTLLTDWGSKRRSRRRSASLPLDLRGFGATGIIGRIDAPEVADAVRAAALPTVALDLTAEQLAQADLVRQVSEIRPDSHKAGVMAAEHFLDRGFRQFAFVGYENRNWSRYRQEAFCARLREADFECQVLLSTAATPWHCEQPEVTQWLKALPKPLAVMACSDVRGREVIEACHLGGLHLPDDVAVLGVDDDRMVSELANPPLSSVALNSEQGGYRAAELLAGLMSGRVKKRQLILVEPSWVAARASTDVIAVQDREIAKAVLFIRENARRPIGVKDVVKHSLGSRRALEIRFRHSLGRSIRDEIERVRLRWAKQLLVETDLSLSKVAECSGFGSRSYLGAVFRRTTGMTLMEYRRHCFRPPPISFDITTLSRISAVGQVLSRAAAVDQQPRPVNVRSIIGR
jgi:LacI family transcriptional regulator